MFEITGILKSKKEAKQATESFKVREFILTDPSTQYPQHIAMQLTQDRCTLLDNVQEGDALKVGFYIKGREWKSPDGELKYFNALEVWKLEAAKSTDSPAKAAAPAFAENDALSFSNAPKKSYVAAEADDDLPF